MPYCPTCDKQDTVHTHCHVCDQAVLPDMDRCIMCGVRAFTPHLHLRGNRPVAYTGDRVNTYDGVGTVTATAPDDFYGAEPCIQGEYVRGEWDGLRYTVALDKGGTFVGDRTRVCKLAPRS